MKVSQSREKLAILRMSRRHRHTQRRRFESFVLRFDRVALV